MAEFCMWMAYFRKNGRSNDIRRFDRPAALIASLISQAFGGKSVMRDFMPFGRDDKDAELEDIISMIGGVNHAKPR